MTKIHNSATCTAGFNSRPCDMCQFAEKAAQRAEHEEIVSPRAENVSAGQQTPGMTVSAPTFTSEWETAPKSMTNYVERGNLRAVLFDVIDTGCTCGSGEQHPWELDDDPNDDERTEDIVNAQRVRFVDEVLKRLRTDPRTAEFWFQRGIHAGRVSEQLETNVELRRAIENRGLR